MTKLISAEQIKYVVRWGESAVQIVFKNLADREPLMVEMRYLHRYLDSAALNAVKKLF